MSDYFAHPTAIIETDAIGQGTRIWAWAHIMPEVVIGKNCNIGDGVFIESGVTVGDGVTIKNRVLLWKGVTIGNGVFLGPNVVFTNDLRPRSSRMPDGALRHKTEAEWLSTTIVAEGASIGANATIVCGIRLGAYSMIGAGAVVTHDVKPYQLVVGNPAHDIGYVNKQGERVSSQGVSI